MILALIAGVAVTANPCLSQHGDVSPYGKQVVPADLHAPAIKPPTHVDLQLTGADVGLKQFPNAEIPVQKVPIQPNCK